jgi:Protein of unknown function (DUF3455)
MSHVTRTIRSAASSKVLGLVALIGLASLLVAAAAIEVPPWPTGCEALEVPAGNVQSFQAFASGVQVYRWNATTNLWDFVGPRASLFSDAGFHSKIGTHYAGPTWESTSGSRVVGAVVEGCLPDPTAIRWLRLAAVTSQGPGVFAGTTWIQRLNTTGGLAPTGPGTTPGQIVEVPYTAEYDFYRAE